MDLLTVAIIFVAGLLLFGLIIFMLNRAWGDFPSRLSPPQEEAPAPPRHYGADALLGAWEAPPTWVDEGDEEDEENEDDEELQLPAGAPAEYLIPVTHPQVKLVVQQALERGGTPYAAYFIREGEQVYLVASRIADPALRARTIQLFQGLNSGDMSGGSLIDMLRTIQQLGR